MFPVALIFHAQPGVHIDTVFELLRIEEMEVTRHVWNGLTLSVQQVRYTTSSCDIVIQTETDDFSQEEVGELANLLRADLRDSFKRSTARIDISPYQPDATREQYETWLNTGIRAEVPRQLSLENPTVMGCAKTIAKAVDGFIFDCTENRFV